MQHHLAMRRAAVLVAVVHLAAVMLAVQAAAPTVTTTHVNVLVGSTTVQVTGTNFVDGDTSVSLMSNAGTVPAVSSVTVVSSTLLAAHLSSALPSSLEGGVIGATVTTSDGTSHLGKVGNIMDVCADGWSSYNDLCYKRHIGHLGFSGYQAVCDDVVDGVIASVHSSSEMDFVTSLFHGYEDSDLDVQLGAKEGFEWQFVDTTVWNSNNFVANWYPSEPDSDGCLRMLGDGRWRDTSCDGYSEGGLCYKPAGSDSSCASGFTLVPGTSKCFKFLTAENSWDGNRASCESAGGLLGMIHTATESTWVINNMPSSIDSVWLGAYHGRYEWRPVWEDWTYLTYTNWKNPDHDIYDNERDLNEPMHIYFKYKRDHSHDDHKTWARRDDGHGDAAVCQAPEGEARCAVAPHSSSKQLTHACAPSGAQASPFTLPRPRLWPSAPPHSRSLVQALLPTASSRWHCPMAQTWSLLLPLQPPPPLS